MDRECFFSIGDDFTSPTWTRYPGDRTLAIVRARGEMALRESSAAIFATLLAGSALKLGACLYLYRSRRSPASRIEGYEFVGRVSELWCFPIKSFRGLQIEEGECTKFGLKWSGVTDRHFTVATANGVYLTQRQEPTMALISVHVHDNEMQLNAPGMETINIPANPPVNSDGLRKVTVKTDTMTSLDCGDAVADWLCRFFHREGLRLHFSAPGLDKRDSYKNLKPWPHLARPGDLMAFSDNCSYNVLTEASIRLLNQRLQTPVTASNFRPNIVVEGCSAFAEDTWTALRIGDVELRAIDHCSRCLMITVDPEKGVKDREEEPLSTLKKFRLLEPYGPKPAFGVNYTLDKMGVIRVGDAVYAKRGSIQVLPKTAAP